MVVHNANTVKKIHSIITRLVNDIITVAINSRKTEQAPGNTRFTRKHETEKRFV